ncbi:MAG: hypothetical protein DMF62_02450 [Acidobacteria bacterium]|nr:MAG: hypothetical protein DMF62_02450 [Acidobacteriota bacterium]
MALGIREIRQLDKEDARESAHKAAAGGDELAVKKLFLWAQWRKIRQLKVPARRKAKLLAQFIAFIEKEADLVVTYG